MRRHLRLSLVTAVLAGAFSLGVLAQTQTPEGRTLTVTFPAEGLVTIDAKNVTIREILAEWSRQTGAVFANAEKLPAQPQTLLFENMPQSRVVDSLLREAAGYLLAPAGGGPVATSNVASVYIIPTSRATSTGAFSSPAAFAPQVVTPGNPTDEIPPVTPATDEPPTEQRPAADNRPTYLGGTGGVGGIVPIVPVPSRGSGAGSGGTTGGGTFPPPTPPPTGSGS